MNSVSRILLWAVIVLTVCVVGFPLYWMVISSVKPFSDLFSRTLSLLPSEHFTLANYGRLLRETMFPQYFLNSLIVSTLATGGCMVVAILAAYGITRFRFVGRRLIASSVLFTYMFPPILLSIPLFVMLKNIGLINSLIGLSLAHIAFTLPLVMWLAIIFFEAIPLDLDEAAMIDGAGRLRTLWLVVLPVALPGLVAMGVFAFIISWNDYLFALVLIVDESKKTLPVGVAGFIEATSVEWGLLMAGGVLITLPVLLGFAFVQKWLIQGLAAGAVKG
ncbi:carbohydrate ABC transporter permease [Aquabacter sp. CN5-332]|uniref:carbohydrate ABC transporter permease n=1 Tax=Aquabacter sp. CN5-332 TaxID=3156608 RepID=UPI0032B3213A